MLSKEMATLSPPSKVELAAYIMLISGVMADHFSTSLGLARKTVYESNPVALVLMNNNIWLLIDIAMILISIFASYVFIRVLKRPIANYILIYPILAGLVRLVISIWNLSIM